MKNKVIIDKLDYIIEYIESYEKKIKLEPKEKTYSKNYIRLLLCKFSIDTNNPVLMERIDIWINDNLKER